MSRQKDVKPYLHRVKNWKVRNMVMLYLQARDLFRKYNHLFRRGKFISFGGMRELCDMLYQIKEDHHLLYKRLLDPKKNKFEKSKKFLPDDIEMDFMNNVGLLFHKVMVARELKYLMEHYVEESDSYQKNSDNLRNQLDIIATLFDDGVEILRLFVARNHDNILLLTLLIENADMTSRHFGGSAVQMIEQFGDGKGLADIYCSVGDYYTDCGRKDAAKRMFKTALKKNSNHVIAKRQLTALS